MPRYAALVLPAANRVYGRAAGALLRAEVATVAAAALGEEPAEVEERRLGGVPAVAFAVEREPDAEGLAALGRLSAAYGLFQLLPGGDLRPLEVPPAEQLPDDLVTIPRYAGRTNERFTRLLVGLALARAGHHGTGARVLDPVCGRGTTLDVALLLGHDAAGVERDAKAVDAHEAFLLGWAKDHRLPHRTERSKLRRDGKVAGRRWRLELAADRATLDAGRGQLLEVVHDDTRHAAEHWRPGTFDAIAADLPYGVQHGSTAAAGRTRRPDDLLAEALPGWLGLLRTGGGVALAFNAKAHRRDAVVASLRGAGLDVADDGPWLGFKHVVDRTITRDVACATKPAP